MTLIDIIYELHDLHYEMQRHMREGLSPADLRRVDLVITGLADELVEHVPPGTRSCWPAGALALPAAGGQ